MNHLGSDPAGRRKGETTTTHSYAIAPGKSVNPANFVGQGAITAFKVRVNGITDPNDQWTALRALTVSGVNVTVPHKGAIIEFLDSLIFDNREPSPPSTHCSRSYWGNGLEHSECSMAKPQLGWSTPSA